MTAVVHDRLSRGRWLQPLYTRSGAVGSVYWDLTDHPRGGDFRRLTQDATLAIDAEHAGELYGKLPDGRRTGRLPQGDDGQFEYRKSIRMRITNGLPRKVS
jgi:hypothetical protein